MQKNEMVQFFWTHMSMSLAWASLSMKRR